MTVSAEINTNHLPLFISHRKARFLAMTKVSDLVSFLGIEGYEFLEMIKEPYYSHANIPRKGGGPARVIMMPHERIAVLQRKLAQVLQAIYSEVRPDEVHGFVKQWDRSKPKYSVQSNALPHCGKRYLLNLDIVAFFPSIRFKAVERIFYMAPFHFKNPHLRYALAHIMTYQEQLPTGAPTSPVISNLVFLPIDKEISDYCRSRSITYTRYGDDMSFSSDDPLFANEATTLFRKMMKKILGQHGFALHPEKTFFRESHQRMQVTGVTVNEKPNISRDRVRLVRSMLSNWQKKGLLFAATQNVFTRLSSGEIEEILKLPKEPIFADHEKAYKEDFIRKLSGHLGYIGSVRGVNDPLYLKYKKRMDDLFSKM